MWEQFPGRRSFQLHSALYMSRRLCARHDNREPGHLGPGLFWSRSSTAPDLLFEQDRRIVRGPQPDPVTHVAVENNAAAFDHVHQQLLRPPALVEFEDQRLADNRCVAADCDPLAVAVLRDDDVGKASNDAVGCYSGAERRAAASSFHDPVIEQARCRRDDTI